MSNGTATAPDWLRAMAYDKTTPLYVNFFFSVPCALLYAAEMVPILVKPTNDFRSAFFRIFAARTFVVSFSKWTTMANVQL
jgi:hypothetical protein